MRKRIFITLLALASLLTASADVTSLTRTSLAGTWQFMIDRNDVGEKNGWYKPEFKFDDTIELPGSMPERLKGDDPSLTTPWVGAIYDSSFYFNPYMQKYRVEGNIKFPFFLTPAKHYVGKAWYKRTFTLDEAAGNLTSYELLLERPHIISKVWVNGEYVGSENSLSVPHRICVGSKLRKGENTIVICIDNDPDKVNVGKDSHSVTDQTQGCWNGIVGKIELRKANRIEQMKVYPDVDNRKARVELELGSMNPKGEKATITLKATSFNSRWFHKVESEPVVVELDGGHFTPVTIELDMGEDMLLWDEFNPQLYHLTAEVKTKNGMDRRITDFGMRKIEIRGKMFYVNNREVVLRGNVENCLFPNTGYPPTDLNSWIKVFQRCKDFGLNHIRFHSYCPPEAAFQAADIVGFYIQPEGPSWPNHGVRLGRGEYIDHYLYEEAKNICDEYGNHPSFTFFAFGNEPAGNWVKWCDEHVPMIKEYDSRHIYPGFSVGGGWAWQPKAEFAVKAGARGLAEWTRRAPESVINFESAITTYNGKDMPGTPITVPFVTHEMGQWCVFPNFAEMPKYKGVNKAKNFEIFRDLLRDNGMECREKDFLMASGKLQTLCYKYETERILRTPNYAGFQYLSINDYSGQGSALVGVTDVFFDEKGYCTAEDFREFCSPIVPLAKIKKFTYGNDESFEADVELSQFGETAVTSTPHWTITATSGSAEPRIIAEGDFANATFPIAQNINLGSVRVPLSNITEAEKCTFTVTLPGTEARNHWDFWVYPTTTDRCDTNKKDMYGKVYVTDSLDAKAMKVLKKGGNVLICAAGKVKYGNDIVQQFLPVFWNTSWFKMRPPHTTGIYVEEDHPAFTAFPTDYHSDLQWWELVNKAQVMQFTEFDSDFQPLVQSIDTWFLSRKIGMLFEAKVMKGKLMMTTMDITSDLDQRLAARQMRSSILQYMNSSSFNPQHTVAPELIDHLFTQEAPKVDMFTNDSPDELKPKLK